MMTKVILAGVVLVFGAAAQDMGGMGGMGGGGGSRGGRGGGMNGDSGSMNRMPPASRSRLDVFSEVLQLNKDQKKELKTTMDDAQKEAVPVKEQILKARTALAEAVAGGKSPDEIKQAEAACAAADLQMQKIELSAFAKIYQMLDKDQVAKVRPVYAMMAGIFRGKNWNEAN
jgi:hypothetical protein